MGDLEDGHDFGEHFSVLQCVEYDEKHIFSIARHIIITNNKKVTCEPNIESPILTGTRGYGNTVLFGHVNKSMTAWEFDPATLTLRLIWRLFFPKRIISILLSGSNEEILVAQKTGDVFLVKGRNGEADEETEVILGHTAVLTSMSLFKINNKTLIATSDYDAKIRVSHFPQSYSLHGYLLGFTNSIESVSIMSNVLFAASVDGVIAVFNIVNCEMKQKMKMKEKLDEEMIDEIEREIAAENHDVWVKINRFSKRKREDYRAEFLFAMEKINILVIIPHAARHLLIFAVGENGEIGEKPLMKINMQSNVSYAIPMKSLENTLLIGGKSVPLQQITLEKSPQNNTISFTRTVLIEKLDQEMEKVIEEVENKAKIEKQQWEENAAKKIKLNENYEKQKQKQASADQD